MVMCKYRSVLKNLSEGPYLEKICSENGGLCQKNAFEHFAFLVTVSLFARHEMH